ncbi:MAG TPA: PP2C family protein-serine/threonine phosphatase [Myxococcaceae bacterium]|nr:PP2C family protein-serine/threonine phosphatase [Myxococcaceae bacterium]
METANYVLGGFCGLLSVVALFAWNSGEMSGLGVAAVCSVFVINGLVSFVAGLFSHRSFGIELFRLGMGVVLAPLVSVMVDGPLAPFWPVYVVTMLGSLILLVMTGQRVLWSRLLVAGSVVLLVLSSLLAPPRDAKGVEQGINGYQLVMVAALIGMIGTVVTNVLAQMSRTLVGLRDRSRELMLAHDALSTELNVAHDIQMLLLPKEPTLPGNEVTGRMIPATSVGGDYYDVITVDGRRSFLAVGDVSGHGLTSGLTMMMARTALLGILEARPDIALDEAYRALNRCLRHNFARMGLQMYMTFVLLESKGQGTFAAVGQHLPLLIYRADTGKVDELELEGVWLGLVDDLTPDMLPTLEVTLRPGDLLVLYTDGVVEHFAGREMFGLSRFKELVCEYATRGPGALIDATIERLKDFSGQQKDDVTLLVVNHVGESKGTRKLEPQPSARTETGSGLPALATLPVRGTA